MVARGVKSCLAALVLVSVEIKIESRSEEETESLCLSLNISLIQTHTTSSTHSICAPPSLTRTHHRGLHQHTYCRGTTSAQRHQEEQQRSATVAARGDRKQGLAAVDDRYARLRVCVLNDHIWHLLVPI